MITLNNKSITITTFPDGSQKFDLVPSYIEDAAQSYVENLYGWLGSGDEDKGDRGYLFNFTWKFQDMGEMFLLASALDHIRADLNENYEKAEVVFNLNVPYLPHARMDKTVDKFEGFMLKYVVEALESMGWFKITVRDVHSDVVRDLINKNEITPVWIFEGVSNLHSEILQEKEGFFDAICFPDAGAMKRYGNSGVFEGLKQTYGEKVRNQKTGEILGLVLKGDKLDETDNVLIVDDICSYGGTFYYMGRELEKHTSGEIHLCVTHLEHSVRLGSMYESARIADSNKPLIQSIYTSDSIYSDNLKRIKIIK